MVVFAGSVSAMVEERQRTGRKELGLNGGCGQRAASDKSDVCEDRPPLKLSGAQRDPVTSWLTCALGRVVRLQQRPRGLPHTTPRKEELTTVQTKSCP